MQDITYSIFNLSITDRYTVVRMMDIQICISNHISTTDDIIYHSDMKDQRYIFDVVYI